jgi:hypothetical protein
MKSDLTPRLKKALAQQCGKLQRRVGDGLVPVAKDEAGCVLL